MTNSLNMNTALTGRKKEIALLKEALTSSTAEMISIIGRRRVGKTFLVRTVYKKFEFFKKVPRPKNKFS